MPVELLVPEPLDRPVLHPVLQGEIGQRMPPDGERDLSSLDFPVRLDGGLILVCDRYVASSVAYGEATGLDPVWLTDMQKLLPSAALTIMLDIAPETAVRRKAVDRDRYERDLALQVRVRESYRRQAAEYGWVVLDGERPKNDIAVDVISAATSQLALP